MCSYLIEIESKEEAEWISATFLENSKFSFNLTIRNKLANFWDRIIILIVISFHFSELWFRRLLRLYGVDGSKWPWHWGHVHMGPFERTVDLLKLALPRTKPGDPESGSDQGLHRHFEGRGLEWPSMLLSTELGHLREEFWTMMRKRPRYFLNTQGLLICITRVTSITIFLQSILTVLTCNFILWLYCIECRRNR